MPYSGNIALEEELDMLNPLRHLMQQSDDSDGGDNTEMPSKCLSVLPRQSHSIHNEIIELSFMGFQESPITISLLLDASPGCGGIAWAAGRVLSNYLAKQGPSFINGRTTLELGSGTGLVGLIAGKLGGKVWITDQAPLLDIMHRNVVLNNLEPSVVAAELNWGSPIPKDIPPPELILAADCVYFEPAFPLLVKTLSDLVDTTGNTEVLFCYKKRRKADKRFFAMLKKVFSWIEVVDDANREVYRREAITLIRLFKRSSLAPSSNFIEEARKRTLGID